MKTVGIAGGKCAACRKAVGSTVNLRSLIACNKDAE